MTEAQDDLTRTVEQLWAAFNRGGVPAVAEVVDPDVDWLPSSAGGRVLHGTGELLAWSRETEASGRHLIAHVYAMERRGDAVVVAGHLRLQGGEATETRTMHWVYRFADGRLRRAEAYETREEALAAVEPSG